MMTSERVTEAPLQYGASQQVSIGRLDHSLEKNIQMLLAVCICDHMTIQSLQNCVLPHFAAKIAIADAVVGASDTCITTYGQLNNNEILFVLNSIFTYLFFRTGRLQK